MKNFNKEEFEQMVLLLGKYGDYIEDTVERFLLDNRFINYTQAEREVTEGGFKVRCIAFDDFGDEYRDSIHIPLEIFINYDEAIKPFKEAARQKDLEKAKKRKEEQKKFEEDLVKSRKEMYERLKKEFE